MSNKKNTIPVYDICSLQGANHLQRAFIAENFASYLLKHPNLHRPHRHSFYHTLLFTKGSGKHSIDFEFFDVRPGQVYFMSPGQVHSWAFDGEVDGYVINFSGDIFRHFLKDADYLEQFSFFSGVAQESVLQLAPQYFEDLKNLYSKILDVVAVPENGHTADLIAIHLLEIFILSEQSKHKETPLGHQQHNNAVLHHFRKLLNRHFQQYRLPKDYAAMLYITPNHLNALCKEVLGKPVGDIIRDRILVEAKRLLVNMDLTIAEIGYQLNFQDNSYFTKFFKKYTGTTPEAFKKLYTTIK